MPSPLATPRSIPASGPNATTRSRRITTRAIITNNLQPPLAIVVSRMAPTIDEF
jgi:hypothetical protein